MLAHVSYHFISFVEQQVLVTAYGGRATVFSAIFGAQAALLHTWMFRQPWPANHRRKLLDVQGRLLSERRRSSSSNHRLLCSPTRSLPLRPRSDFLLCASSRRSCHSLSMRQRQCVYHSGKYITRYAKAWKVLFTLFQWGIIDAESSIKNIWKRSVVWRKRKFDVKTHLISAMEFT